MEEIPKWLLKSRAPLKGEIWTKHRHMHSVKVFPKIETYTLQFLMWGREIANSQLNFKTHFQMLRFMHLRQIQILCQYVEKILRNIRIELLW